MRIIPERCPEGQELFSQAARCTGSINERQIAWYLYQCHWLECEQCAAHRDSEWKEAERLPPVPHQEENNG